MAEEYDSDETVILEDLDKNPDIVARKRHKLETLCARLKRTNYYATKHGIDENTASFYSNNTRIDGPTLKNNTNNNLTPNKDTDGRNARNNDNHEDKENVHINMRDELDVKKELHKQEGLNDDIEQSIDDVISISDDDCGFDEIEHQCTSGERVDELNNFIDNQVDENITGGKIRVLKPSAINARRATLDSFERNVTELGISNLVSATNEKEIKPRMKDLKSSAINTRRATVTCAESNETESWNVIDRSTHDPNVLDKLSAENVKRPKIVLRLLKTKTNDKAPGQNITYQRNEEGSFGDDYRKTDDSTVSRNTIRDKSNPNNNKNVHTNERNVMCNELDVKKELLKQESDIDNVEQTVEDVINTLNDDGVNEPGNIDNDSREKDELNSCRNICHGNERKPSNDALDIHNMPCTSNINPAEVLINCSSVTAGKRTYKSKTMHKNKAKSSLNGNKKACASENLTINTNENGFNNSTAITLEPERDNNNANKKKSNTNDSGITKVLSAHETRKAIKRLSKTDNSSIDSKRARNDKINIPDGVPCSSVETNAEKIDFTDTENMILNSLEEDSHKTREENGENADMLLNEKGINKKYINKRNVHDGTCDERNQADIDEKIERVVKFQVGFCTLMKEHLKEKCQNYALEPEVTKAFLKSVNLLANEIEALKTLANADFKFFCPLCRSVTTFVANDNESNSQNHENCVLCCRFKSIHKEKMEIYFNIQSNNKNVTQQSDQNIIVERAQENIQTVTAPHKNDNVAISSVNGNAEETVDKLRSEDTSVIDMLSISNNDDSSKRVKSVFTKVITNMPSTSKKNVDCYNAVGCIPSSTKVENSFRRQNVSVKHLSESTVRSLEKSPIVETTNRKIPSKSYNNKDLSYKDDSILAKTNILSKISRVRCRSEEMSVKETDQCHIGEKLGANIPSTSIDTDVSKTKARNRRHSEETSLRTANKRFKGAPGIILPSKSKTNDDSRHATNKANMLTEKAGHKRQSESVTSVGQCPFVRSSDLNMTLTSKGNNYLNQGVHSEVKIVVLTEKGANNRRSQAAIIKDTDKEPTLELSATNIPSSFKNTDVSNHRLENCPTKVTTSTLLKLASEETSELNIPLMSKNNDPSRRTDSASAKDNSTVAYSDRRKNENIPVPSLEKLPLVLNKSWKSNNNDDLKLGDEFHQETNVITLKASDRLQSEKVSITTANKRPHDENETNKNRITDAGMELKALTTKVVEQRPSKEASDTHEETCHIIKSSDLNMPSTSKKTDAPNQKQSEKSPIKGLTDHNMPPSSKSNDHINQNHNIVSVVSKTTHSPKRRFNDDESPTKRFRTDVDINADEKNKNDNMKMLSNRETKKSVATTATAEILSIEKHAAIPNIFLVTENDSQKNQEAIHIKNQSLNSTRNKDQEKDNHISSIIKEIGETSEINHQGVIRSQLSRTNSSSNQTDNSDLSPPIKLTKLKLTENGQKSKSKRFDGTHDENDTGGESYNGATNLGKASETSEALASNKTNQKNSSDGDESDDESETTEDADDATDDENNDPETNEANSRVSNSLEVLSTRIKTTMNTTNKPVESVSSDSTVKNKQNKKYWKPEIRYMCEICSCVFTYHSRYLNHMNNDHDANDFKTPENCKILRCRFCYVELNQKSYNLHVKQRHPDKYLAKENKGNVIINSSKIDTRLDIKDAQDTPSIIKRKYEFKCLICKKTLYSFHAARRHRKTKHSDLKYKKKLYEKTLINAEIGRHDTAHSHEQDKSYEVTNSTSNDEGENETSDCDEEVQKEHVEDDNDEGAAVGIEENGSDEASQLSRNEDENKNDSQDDKNNKEKISNTKSRSISSDNNNIDSDEKDPSSVVQTDHNRTNLSKLTDDQESTRVSSDSEETCKDTMNAIHQEDSNKNLAKSNSTLDYSNEKDKTHDYIYKCKLSDEISNSGYACRIHRKTKHIKMNNRKLFIKTLVTDASTCSYDVLDGQIESHKDKDECDEDNQNDVSHDGVDKNTSEEHGNKSNQENEQINCVEHDAHLIDRHDIDREGEIFKQIARIDANVSCDESSTDKNGRIEAHSDDENDYTARRHIILCNKSLSNETLRRRREDDEASQNERAPSLGGFVSKPLDNKSVEKGLSGQEEAKVNHGEQNDEICTENGQNKRGDRETENTDELLNNCHDSNDKRGKELEKRVCVLENSTDMKEYKQCQRLEKNKNISNDDNAWAESNKNKVDVSVNEVKKRNASPKIPKISRSVDQIHENNAQNGSKGKEEHRRRNEGICNNNNKKTDKGSCNKSGNASKTKTDCDEDDSNGSNSNVDNKQMTEDDYVFKCQECEHTTKIYDNVIQHCQNHYTLKDIHANSLESNYDEKNNKVIKYTYKSLFKDWDRIFDDIPLYIAKDVKARSVYKTFCVKMSIIENGSWKHSLYQCGLCATCVPPKEIELHCQEKCYYISYPCSLAACNIPFSTNAARDDHEKNHAAAFRLVAFNNKRDKDFNNTLFEVRKKTQQHEQESIDVQQQHKAQTQQRDNSTQQEENKDTQLELINSQQEKDSIQLQEHIDNEQEKTSESNQENTEIRTSFQKVDSQQQNNDSQQQNADPQHQNNDLNKQDVDPQQQTNVPQQVNNSLKQSNVDPQQQKNDLQQQKGDPQERDVDPQQQNNDPQQQNVDSQQQNNDPQQQNADPQHLNNDLNKQDVDPQQRDVDPQQQTNDLQQQNNDPQQHNVDPQQQKNDPQQRDVDPQQQNIIKTPEANIYKCQCDLCFINSKNFKKHFIDCNLKPDSGILCQKCAVPRLFETEELEEHMALHHEEIKYKFKVHFHRVEVKVEEENPSEIRIKTEQRSPGFQAEELLNEDETINLISDEED